MYNFRCDDVCHCDRAQQSCWCVDLASGRLGELHLPDMKRLPGASASVITVTEPIIARSNP